LASFYQALDCAPANNRLKRRSDNIEPGSIQVFAGNGPQLQYRDHFLDANGRSIRVRKVFCHHAGKALRELGKR
jgi:hypothetical protein